MKNEESPQKSDVVKGLIIASLAGSFSTAILYFIVIWAFLPPDDDAYGLIGLTAILSEPVLSIMAMFCLVAAAIAFPLLYWGARDKPLRATLPTIFGAVYLSVIVATPIAAGLGLIAPYLALVGACLYLRLKSDKQKE